MLPPQITPQSSPRSSVSRLPPIAMSGVFVGFRNGLFFFIRMAHRGSYFGGSLEGGEKDRDAVLQKRLAWALFCFVVLNPCVLSANRVN